MDQGENHLQSIGVYQRLVNFMVKSLTAIASRPMTLPYPVRHFWLICQRFFNFIMLSLATQALKPVTLGHPMPISDASQNGTPHEDVHFGAMVESEQAIAIQQLVPLTTFDSKNKEVEKDGKEFPLDRENGVVIASSTAQGINDLNANEGKKGEDEVVTVPAIAPQTKAPKKMVSINDNVEEIYPSKKKKTKAIEKLPSMEREKEETKPLKPILKTGSNVSAKSESNK
ncbi:unnamed protein product [Ilex paraguariensis]|uniref:Uncharacterized protein n=1 Tax=Ilex paraguariensis TaxID=185542 RepID=A0ABC8UPV7_9AQUA